jgi:hypothetical protein
VVVSGEPDDSFWARPAVEEISLPGPAEFTGDAGGGGRGRAGRGLVARRADTGVPDGARCQLSVTFVNGVRHRCARSSREAHRKPAAWLTSA